MKNFERRKEIEKWGQKCECKCAIDDHADDGNTHIDITTATATTIDIRSDIAAFVTLSELFTNLITMTQALKTIRASRREARRRPRKSTSSRIGGSARCESVRAETARDKKKTKMKRHRCA